MAELDAERALLLDLGNRVRTGGGWWPARNDYRTRQNYELLDRMIEAGFVQVAHQFYTWTIAGLRQVKDDVFMGAELRRAWDVAQAMTKRLDAKMRQPVKVHELQKQLGWAETNEVRRAAYILAISTNNAVTISQQPGSTMVPDEITPLEGLWRLSEELIMNGSPATPATSRSANAAEPTAAIGLAQSGAESRAVGSEDAAEVVVSAELPPFVVTAWRPIEAADAIRRAVPANTLLMEHLLLGLFRRADGRTLELFAGHGIRDEGTLRDALRAVGAVLDKGEALPTSHFSELPAMSEHAGQALRNAAQIAIAESAPGEARIRGSHLLRGALSVDGCHIVEALRRRGPALVGSSSGPAIAAGDSKVATKPIALILRGPGAVGKTTVLDRIQSTWRGRGRSVRLVRLDEGWETGQFRRSDGPATDRYQDLLGAPTDLLLVRLGWGEPDWGRGSALGASRNPKEWVDLLRERYRLVLIRLSASWQLLEQRLRRREPTLSDVHAYVYEQVDGDLIKFSSNAGLPETIIKTDGLNADQVTAAVAQQLRALESVGGPAPTPVLPNVVADVVDGEDLLDITGDVRTLCSVLLSKSISPPLSVGLFGDWGSGKTFFIERMRREIALLSSLSKGKGARSAFHENVVQISFNAWHYVDTNLWASLVSRIFEQLAQEVTPAPESPEGARRRLFRELETAREMKAEATAEKARAEERLETAGTALQTIARKRAETELRLSKLRAPDLIGLLDTPTRTSLSDALAELGLPAAIQSLQGLADAAREAHTLAGRVRSTLHAFFRDPKGVRLLAALAAGLIVLALVVIYVMRRWAPALTGLGTVIAEFVGGLTAATTLARKYTATVDGALQKLEQARDNANQLSRKKREEKEQGESALEQDIAKLRSQEVAASQALDTASARVAELEQRIREIDEGRSLSKFLYDRVHGGDYERHLGLISVIRRDFEKLERLLRDSSDLKTVDRIVLYVDDLDRCPSDKVVDVLQAVHLLLAVPLFVVVVGVDSRWLLHSLQKQFTGFSQPPSDSPDAQWVSTPQAYLEKIFQIPFAVRRMNQSGYKQLMGALLTSTAPGEPPSSAVRSVARVAGAKAEVLRGTGSTSGAEPARQADEPQSDAARGSTEVRDLQPSGLDIRSWEAAVADKLHVLLPTPRSAKRFANVYRLLKAGVPANELERFEGTEAAPGDFQIAMVLLALLTGYPRVAVATFRRIQEAKAEARWREVILGEPRSLSNRGADDGPSNAEVLNALVSRLALADERVAPFQGWVPRVARFSFDAARFE